MDGGMLVVNLLAIAVGVAGMTALFAPQVIARLKARHPPLFWALLVVAVLLQAPYLLSTAWGFGMQASPPPTMGWLLVATFLLLPLVYFAMFVLSIAIQRQRVPGDPSFLFALLASFLTTPFVHATAVAVLSRWFGPS